MEDLVKKLEQLRDLIKAVKQMKPAGPTLPSIPAPKLPAPPSLTPKASTAPKIGVGQGPNSKKDPKKVAEQIKNGSMSTKTQKVMLKVDNNGQWELTEKIEAPKPNPKDPVLNPKLPEKPATEDHIKRVQAYLKSKGMIKADSTGGQWYLEPTDPSNV